MGLLSGFREGRPYKNAGELVIISTRGFGDIEVSVSRITLVGFVREKTHRSRNPVRIMLVIIPVALSHSNSPDEVFGPRLSN